MDGPAAQEFVEDLLVAPAALALLGRLEGAQRDDSSPWDEPPDPSRRAVQLAASSLATMSWGGIALTVNAADMNVGPWSGEGPATLPRLYECAQDRLPIAEALVAIFGDRLCQTPEP
jgi:hypothetical protein